jgi:hypothetical protein
MTRRGVARRRDGGRWISRRGLARIGSLARLGIAADGSISSLVALTRYEGASNTAMCSGEYQLTLQQRSKTIGAASQ